MRNDRDNIIVNKTFQFSIGIVEFCETLSLKNKYVISNQLLKSGTSIGANVREAQNAESKADFIHKMKIAAKEADETIYWLELCKHSKDHPFNDNLINEATEITKILSTSKN